MRTRIGTLCLVLALSAGTAAAQMGPKTPNAADIYCSGMVSTESVSHDTYVISGEESHWRIGWTDHEYVYINKGSSQGAKVGDEFLVMRPIKDTWRWKWFASEPSLRLAMGRQWMDVGRLRIAVVHPDVSIAEVTYSCTQFNRGDYVRPFAERPAPQFKASKFNRWAPVSGRPMAMLVSSKNYLNAVFGTNDIVYVNLGSAQGVKVGDYFRVFRYQGTRHEKVYQARWTAHRLYGFGAAPKMYRWDELPREVLGEGIVLNVSENSSTVLITHSLREMFLGDYVELENPEPVAEAQPAAAPPPPPANRAPALASARPIARQ